ncbi:MAG: nitrous oxide reductase accessory protein NosL [Campylobacteraceae bacterium]|nr:nitrous oxide reductase accessory protein NosL [Campylobacteraceae bacterium]
MKNLVKLLAVCLFFVGCDSRIDMSAKDIKIDRDVCAHCKMVISSANYAAQVVTKDGKRYFFDDIGCALAWLDLKDKEMQESSYIYAADFQSAEWINAREAYYTSGANSPMHYGFAAHKKDLEDAENFDFAHVKKAVIGKDNESNSTAHHTH